MFRRLLPLIVCLAVTSGATAQTVGYADAIQILSKSCGSDISRYCGNATLANYGIGRCLEGARDKVSSQCLADLDRVRRDIAARSKAQADAESICANDIRRLCPMTQRGRGHVLVCMLKAEPSVSKRCNQAITDAGWR